MMSQGYKRITMGQCVYFQKLLGGYFVALLLYVDNMLIVGKDATKIKTYERKTFQVI